VLFDPKGPPSRGHRRLRGRSRGWPVGTVTLTPWHSDGEDVVQDAVAVDSNANGEDLIHSRRGSRDRRGRPSCWCPRPTRRFPFVLRYRSRELIAGAPARARGVVPVHPRTGWRRTRPGSNGRREPSRGGDAIDESN